MKILSRLQLIFLILAAGFIGHFLVVNSSKVNLQDFSFVWSSLVWSGLTSAISVFFLASKLDKLYESELPQLKFKQVFKTVAKTNLFRYIPGGIWNHTGLAIEAANVSGKSLKTTAKLQVLNILFMVYTGSLFLFFVLPVPFNWFLILSFILGLGLLKPGFMFINRFWQKFNFKQKLNLQPLAQPQLVKIVVDNLLFWLFNGLSFVFFLHGLGVLKSFGLGQGLYLAASYTLAWLAGFLFLPAPTGMGVREAVLSFLLNRVGLTLALGVSASLLFRLFILIRDIFIFFFSLLLKPEDLK